MNWVDDLIFNDIVISIGLHVCVELVIDPVVIAVDELDGDGAQAAGLEVQEERAVSPGVAGLVLQDLGNGFVASFVAQERLVGEFFD